MHYKLRDIVDSMDYEDVLKLQRDVNSGGTHLKKFLKDKVSQQEKQHGKFCTTCFSEIDQRNVNNFTLVFGPHDFRKKASFDGIDCLEYFLKNLKEMKKQ